MSERILQDEKAISVKKNLRASVAGDEDNRNGWGFYRGLSILHKTNQISLADLLLAMRIS